MQLNCGKQRSVRSKGDLPTYVNVDKALQVTADEPIVQLAPGGQRGSARRDGGALDQLRPARGVKLIWGVVPIPHHQEVGVAPKFCGEGSEDLGIGRVLQACTAQKVQRVNSQIALTSREPNPRVAAAVDAEGA